MRNNTLNLIAMAFLFLVIVFVMEPKSQNSPIVTNEDLKISSGLYLGQQPPGFVPELFAPGVISSGANDMDITFTPDGNEIFFSRSGPDWFSAILQMERVQGRWNGPFIAPFPNIHSFVYPFVNPDGKTLYLESNADIYFSKKNNHGWSSPIQLDSNINTDQREGFVSAALNGNLYFSANYKNTIGGMDIYMSKYIDSEYREVVHLNDSINSEYNEFHACISPDEKYLIFDSQKPGGFGRNDLYISFRQTDGTWSKAQNMGKSINTEMNDMRPYITPDGKFLFFSSDRSVPIIAAESKNLSYNEFMKKIDGSGNGSQDIFWVDIKIIDNIKSNYLK